MQQTITLGTESIFDFFETKLEGSDDLWTLHTVSQIRILTSLTPFYFEYAS